MDSEGPPPKQPVLLFPIQLPRTKRISFHNVIQTQNIQTKEILAQTSAFRDELFQACEDGHNATVISACESYFPLLFGLIESVEYNTNLYLHTPLQFSWSSPFVEKAVSKPFMSYVYRHEVIMVALAYGIAHYNRAVELLSQTSVASFEEESKKIVVYLKTAAGIFEYIHVNELGRWIDIPPDRPPELNSSMLKALQEYAVTAAQSITMKKGMATVATKLLAKLAVQNWRQSERFEVACKSTSKNYKETLPRPLRKFLPINTALAKATAFRYMAKDAYESQKYGLAASYATVSAASLRKMKKRPISQTVLKSLGKEIDDSIFFIEHIQRKYFLENEHVYYQRNLPEEQLEIVEPKSVVTVTMWIPPPAAYRLV